MFYLLTIRSNENKSYQFLLKDFEEKYFVSNLFELFFCGLRRTTVNQKLNNTWNFTPYKILPILASPCIYKAD